MHALTPTIAVFCNDIFNSCLLPSGKTTAICISCSDLTLFAGGSSGLSCCGCSSILCCCGGSMLLVLSMVLCCSLFTGSERIIQNIAHWSI